MQQFSWCKSQWGEYRSRWNPRTTHSNECENIYLIWMLTRYWRDFYAMEVTSVMCGKSWKQIGTSILSSWKRNMIFPEGSLDKKIPILITFSEEIWIIFLISRYVEFLGHWKQLKVSVPTFKVKSKIGNLFPKSLV